MMYTYVALGASLLGLIASTYIYRKKRAKKKLVCPLRANCEKVIHSTHATTLGIPNELLGILYYLLVGALYLSTLLPYQVLPITVANYAILILTIVGGLFTLYLIAVQAFVIRGWCSWCMLSAIATALFVVALFHLPLASMHRMLIAHQPLWLIVHGLGFVLGLGSATITDVLFFRFLKDHQISAEEQSTFETITNVIWIGLAILLLSGTMLYLAHPARLAASAKFLVKVVVVGVITVNGIALNLLVSPRLRQLSFDGSVPAGRFRRLAFALGGISIVSWYTAFILGSIRSIPITFQQGVLAYVILIFFVVIGSQFAERRMVLAATTR